MFGGVEMKINWAFSSGDLPVTGRKKNTDQLIALVGTAIQHAVKNTAGYTKNMNCICCTPSRPDRLDCHWHCCILSSPWHWRLSFLTLRRVGRSTHYPIGQLEGPACVSKRKWGVHNQQWGPEVLVLDRLSYHESSCILCILYLFCTTTTASIMY